MQNDNSDTLDQRTDYISLLFFAQEYRNLLAMESGGKPDIQPGKKPDEIKPPEPGEVRPPDVPGEIEPHDTPDEILPGVPPEVGPDHLPVHPHTETQSGEGKRKTAVAL
jgi:hypothetical protein